MHCRSVTAACLRGEPKDTTASLWNLLETLSQVNCDRSEGPVLKMLLTFQLLPWPKESARCSLDGLIGGTQRDRVTFL